MFTNELVAAIKNNKNVEFRNRFRNVDVLMLDDIQFIAGRRFHAGRVFPHVQRPAQRGQADHHFFR